MGSFAVGDVVLVPFPYADFSRFKKRPALIVGHAEFSNLILCQITSRAQTSSIAIPLRDIDFSHGSLNLDSYIRYDKLFTIEQQIIDRKIGILGSTKIDSVIAHIKDLFN